MSWNQPHDNGRVPRRPQGRRPLLRGLVAGVVVVTLGLVAVFFLRSTASSPSHSGESPRPRSARPGRSARPAAAPSVPNHSNSTAAATPSVTNEFFSGKYPGEKIVSVSTNSAGFLVEHTVDARGRRTRHVSSPPSPWKHGTDEIIANVLSTPQRGEMAPLPPMGPEMDARFRASLKDPIVTKEDDSEEMMSLREIVRSARAEILARMDAGEHFADILNDHRKLHNDNGRIRGDAVHELKSILAKGDEEGARQYLDRMNAAFSQMGITPISVEDTKPHGRRNR